MCKEGLDYEITAEELKTASYILRPNKSSGIDGISNEMFTRLMSEAVRRNMASSHGYAVVTRDHHGDTFEANPI